MTPPANKGRRYPAETLSPDEVRALFRAITGRSSTAVRDRAMLATMYRGALRANEVVGLMPHDLDLDSGTLRVRDGKAGPDGVPRMRVVAIDELACYAVVGWLEHRPALGLDGRHPLFPTLKGGRLQTSHLRRLLPRLAERAGLERRVHPHILRHTRAAELAQAGVPVNVIQRALGHTSLTTTVRYLDHVAPQQVIAAMRTSDWRPPSPQAPSPYFGGPVPF